jgi:large subunit ribosomal protein L7/L12
VKLIGVDAARKINAIKELRTINSALQLKEAKDLVESLPKVVKDNVTKDEAEEIKKKFASVGATVQID